MRVLFLIAWILVLFAIAGNIQAGWLYVLVALFAVIILISVAMPYWNLRGLTVECRPPEFAARGEAASVVWTVSNPNRLGRRLLLVLPQQDGCSRPEGFAITALRGGESRMIRGKLVPERRGAHRIKEAHLVSGAPVGAHIVRRRIALDHTVLVHPPIGPADDDFASKILSGRDRGDARTTPFSDPDQFKIRTYAPGDEIKKIHWKLSAKKGEMIVLDEERRAAGDFLILVDDRAAAYGAGLEDPAFEDLLGQAISLARGLVFDLKSEVALKGYIEPGITVENEKEWDRALKWFALIGLKREPDEAAERRVEEEREDRLSRVVVFSPKT